jgi:hypothetical protein
MSSLPTCRLCNFPIQAREDYTVRACCGTKYHAGCIHRRYVSGPRECPNCNKEPQLCFDTAPFSVQARVQDSLPPPSVGGLGALARVFGKFAFSARVDQPSVGELLTRGVTWQEMKDAGMDKESLIESGLDYATANRHKTLLKAVFGFDASDFARLPIIV